MVNPASLWLRSCRAHRLGRPRRARALKAVNFFLFHCVLPPEADLRSEVTLYHHGLGVVVHPSTQIGDGVTFAHGVTIAAGGIGPSPRVIIEAGAHIGAGATVLATNGKQIRIGRDASIGANALVIRDVPSGARVLAPPGSIPAVVGDGLVIEFSGGTDPIET